MLKAISTITNALGALNYKGTWNASSNTPTLADGTGAKGDYYVVSTAGTQTFGGVQLFFGTGDWIAYNGAVWQRVEGGSDGNFANVTLTSTDAGATASPLLELYRDSATPAASDTLGEIKFNGEDSAGNKQAYGLIHASILSPTSTAEQGQLHFETATAGALTEKMIIGTTNLVINEIGAVFNVRIEGDTDANLLYTDATNDKVGLGTASPAEKLDVVGKIKLSDNLVIGTDGKGIDFSVTSSGTGTMTSELLDDYEEGTWTPLLTCSDGNFTSVTYDPLRGGSYTKVGNMVHVQCYMRTDAVDNTVARTGDVLIGGLPFTAISGTGGTLNGHCSLAVSVASAWAGDEPIGAFISGGDNNIQLMSRAAVNGNTSNITATAVGTGANANIVLIGGTYLAA
jgi:hypothetical protein